MSGNAAVRGPGERLDRALAARRGRGRPGIMSHLVFGYPDVEESRRQVEIMARAGVDIVELQIPFSDPTADGPVITRACQDALRAGARTAGALALVAEATRAHDVPVLIMAYVNLAFAYAGGEAAGGGLRAFVRDAARAGAAGLIVPDLPPEAEREGFSEACREEGIHAVRVVSPNATDARLERVREAGSGLVYCTSRTGTTGKEMDLSLERLRGFLERARRITRRPLAVGFSISRPEQVDALRGLADVAVIGSHWIRVRERDGLEGLEAELRRFVDRAD